MFGDARYQHHPTARHHNPKALFQQNTEVSHDSESQWGNFKTNPVQATRFVQERNLYTKVRSEEKRKTSKEAGEYYCSGTSKHKPSKHNCRRSSANSEQVSSNSKELQHLPQHHV